MPFRPGLSFQSLVAPHLLKLVAGSLSLSKGKFQWCYQRIFPSIPNAIHHLSAHTKNFPKVKQSCRASSRVNKKSLGITSETFLNHGLISVPIASCLVYVLFLLLNFYYWFCKPQVNFIIQRLNFTLRGSKSLFKGSISLSTAQFHTPPDNFLIQRHDFALRGTIPTKNGKNGHSTVKIDFFTTKI